MGVYEYIDESTNSLQRDTVLNDPDVDIDGNDNIFGAALKALTAAQSSSTAAVVIPTIGMSTVPPDGANPSSNDNEEQSDEVFWDGFDCICFATVKHKIKS